MRTRLRNFKRAQALVMFALLLVVLLLFIGLCIDIGFGCVTKLRIAKAVDAATVTGIRNLSLGQSTAENLALRSFNANYANSRIDVTAPTPQIAFGVDAANNTILDVSASTQIRTFFIGLAGFQTLNVGASAQGLRTKLIMSLVLDRSGSMQDNGGDDEMPGAVSSFLDYFDDAHDRVSMSSFAYHGRTDVPLSQPFKSAINSAVASLNYDGWTCSEQGLVKGRQQIEGVTIQPGEAVVKALVFFTDGMANSFQYNFDCGARNMTPNACPPTLSTPGLRNPDTGAAASAGCTIPQTIPSIAPPFTPFNPRDRIQLQQEAEKRAIHAANQARAQGIHVYAIGLGNPNQGAECNGTFPVINPAFLRAVANDPDSPGFDPNQPEGAMVIAANANELKAAFDTIAAKIIFRLSR